MLNNGLSESEFYLTLLHSELVSERDLTEYYFYWLYKGDSSQLDMLNPGRIEVYKRLFEYWQQHEKEINKENDESKEIQRYLLGRDRG